MISDCDEGSWLAEVAIAAMAPADLEEVLAIERRSFPSAWTRESYAYELGNCYSHYFVARFKGELVGYMGMSLLGQEAHITTLAVHPERRRRGLGAHLLQHLLALAGRQGAERISLEVREGNQAARALYRKFDFEEKGLLARYYGDTGENGLLMCRTLRRQSGLP